MATTHNDDSLDADEQYYTSRGPNRTWKVHSERDCHHLERAGEVRRVREEELADAVLCQRCAGESGVPNDGVREGGCPRCGAPPEEIEKLAYHLPECPGGDGDE